MQHEYISVTGCHRHAEIWLWQSRKFWSDGMAMLFCMDMLCASWFLSLPETSKRKKPVTTKFCVKLGNNLTERHEMLQIAHWDTSLPQAQTFQEFSHIQDGREDVKDDLSSRGSVRSTRGLGPTMTARGQSIGISIGMLPQTLIMSITVQKTSKYYTTEFDLEEGFLNGACISISNLPENIAWQTHRPEARGPLKSGAWGGRPTCHPQTPPLLSSEQP